MVCTAGRSTSRIDPRSIIDIPHRRRWRISSPVTGRVSIAGGGKPDAVLRPARPLRHRSTGADAKGGHLRRPTTASRERSVEVTPPVEKHLVIAGKVSSEWRYA